MSYNFNNSNLIETTSELQASRGNRSFLDTSNNVRYISYSNGYVRRELHFTLRNGIVDRKQYQLNKQTLTPLQGVKRIAITNEDDRLALIDKLSKGYNYRGYGKLIK